MLVALHVENGLRQFAAHVGAVRVVTLDHCYVIKVELPAYVRVRHDIDDATRSTLAQLLCQKESEVKVAQVVDPQTSFVTVVCSGFRT